MSTSMKAGRCLGLVGGLGVGAAVHYYVNLAKAHHEQGRALDMVMVHAEPPRVMDFLRASDREGMARYLARFILRMEDAGAEFAVVPAVTPHYCIRELIAISPLPLLNVFEPLEQELAARALKRIAVLGTRFVIESDLFGEVPSVEFVRPQPAEIERIHEIYTKLALSGEASPGQHAELSAIAHELIRRDKVDAVLLGGTDLALLFNDSNTDFPHVDVAGVHIRAIARKMLED
jgi:aspartate racemase